MSQAERELIAAFATRARRRRRPDRTFYAARAARRRCASERAVVLAEAAEYRGRRALRRLHRGWACSARTPRARATHRRDVATSALGERLAAALAHTHLLVLRPREAPRPISAAAVDAGWSADGIVTLSQLVAFLAFQQRVVAGLQLSRRCRQRGLAA